MAMLIASSLTLSLIILKIQIQDYYKWLIAGVSLLTSYLFTYFKK
jgi:hypothetical protein